MPDPLSNVDWCLLRAQRNYLLVYPSAHKHVDGLINFLDGLIDHALDTCKLIGLFSPDTLEVGTMYKYVDVGGEFRFFSMDDQHRQAVGNDEREDLRSAGKIAIHPDCIKMIERGSISLKIPGDAGDDELLADLLGKPVKEVQL